MNTSTPATPIPPQIQYSSYTPTPSQISTSSTATANYTNHYPNVPIQVQQPTSSYYSPYATSTANTAINATTSTSGGGLGTALSALSLTTTSSGLSGLGISSTTGLYLHNNKQTNPAPARPPEPPEPTVTPKVASNALKRLIENEVINVGFEKAESQTIKRLELEVTSFVEQMFERAHEYANLANRTGALITDLLLACDDFGITMKDIYPIAHKRRLPPTQPALPNPNSDPNYNPNPMQMEISTPITQGIPTPTTYNYHSTSTSTTKTKKHKKRKPKIMPAQLLSSISRSPSPELLQSDDETGPPIIPTTLRGLPPYFPQLPPKHTYLQTPASPPKKAALPSLEKKLKTAGLVQESLKNLLLATEDSTGQEDAELLGHIVNWETGLHPRKRWRVGGGGAR